MRHFALLYFVVAFVVVTVICELFDLQPVPRFVLGILGGVVSGLLYLRIGRQS